MTTTTTATATRPKLSDVKVADGVHLDQVKGKDEREVLVELKPRTGFMERQAQALVERIQARSMNGSRGHLPTGDRGHAFPTVAVSWIGALWQDGSAWIRGIVHDQELARWIDAGRVGVDPEVEGNFFALDFMSGTDWPGRVVQEGEGSSTTSNGDGDGGKGGESSGEMNGGSQQPKITFRGNDGKVHETTMSLPVRRRSIATGETSQTPAAQQPVGLPVKKRSV